MLQLCISSNACLSPNWVTRRHDFFVILVTPLSSISSEITLNPYQALAQPTGDFISLDPISFGKMEVISHGQSSIPPRLSRNLQTYTSIPNSGTPGGSPLPVFGQPSNHNCVVDSDFTQRNSWTTPLPFFNFYLFIFLYTGHKLVQKWPFSSQALLNILLGSTWQQPLHTHHSHILTDTGTPQFKHTKKRQFLTWQPQHCILFSHLLL